MPLLGHPSLHRMQTKHACNTYGVLRKDLLRYADAKSYLRESLSDNDTSFVTLIEVFIIETAKSLNLTYIVAYFVHIVQLKSSKRINQFLIRYFETPLDYFSSQRPS